MGNFTACRVSSDPRRAAKNRRRGRYDDAAERGKNAQIRRREVIGRAMGTTAPGPRAYQRIMAALAARGVR